MRSPALLLILLLLTLLLTLANASDESTCKTTHPRIHTAVQRFCTTGFFVPSNKAENGYTVKSEIHGDWQARTVAIKSGTCTPQQWVDADVCKRVFYGMCVRYADRKNLVQSFGGGCLRYTIADA